MNKAEVITKVAERTGMEPSVCDRIIKVLEQQTGETFSGKLTGIVTSHSGILAGVAERTGFSSEDCQKVLTAFEEVVKAGVFDKLKGLFSR
jgi:nucleoid DNA-binding protein